VDITVVDNASGEEEVASLCEIEERVSLIKSVQNGGFAAGVNLGVALVPAGRWILLLNPDAFISTESLEKLVSEAVRLGLDICSPVIINPRTNRVWYVGGTIDRSQATIRQPGGISQQNLVSPPRSPFVSGCAMLISPNAVEKYFPMTEQFFMYWEDTDLCLRAYRDGARMGVVLDAIGYHEEGSSSADGAGMSSLYYYHMARNRIWLVKDHGWYFSRLAYPYSIIVAARTCKGILREGNRPIRKCGSVLKGTAAGMLRSGKGSE
jgi:hypothetical protein